MSNPSIDSRVKETASFLNIDAEEILKFLASIGIENSDEGLKLLDSEVASYALVETVFSSVFDKLPLLKRKAAVSILKGSDPFKKPSVEVKETSQNEVVKSLVDAVSSMKDIYQLKDLELLEMFDKDRDPIIEEELNRRAKGQRFIILKSNTDTDTDDVPIDIKLSHMLLRKTRKMKIPSIMPSDEGKVVPVYKITELNIDDRIVEICPICGEILFKGYCSKCALNFSDIEIEARQIIKLIVDEGKVNVESYSDKKALMADAIKGVMSMRQIWPSIDIKYRELKLSDNLPKLKMVKTLPSEQVADPFHVRTQHKKY